MGIVRRLLSKVMRPNRKKCEETRALMSDYVDCELDAEDRKGVERHVRFCHRCHTVLGNLRQTLARLHGIRDSEPMGGDDPAAVTARVARGWRDRA